MTTPRRLHLPELPLPVAIDIPPAAFQLIQDLLAERKGFTLASYKDKCVRRRITLRIRATFCNTAEEYCRLLQEDVAELDRLFRTLTIHVSQFFRNAAMFEKLRHEVLPDLFRRCRAEDCRPLRILSVGCAGGEEPYSVAILLRETFSAELERCGVQLTGIDIDPSTLETAQRGIFGEDHLKELTPAMINRFFALRENRYVLDATVKELVTFRLGDMVHDPLPEADLILCRNALIYLERAEQERVLASFARSLPPGGVLVLGKSETLVGTSRQQFHPICITDRIFRRPAGDGAAAELLIREYGR